MPQAPTFTDLAATPEPALDVLALALVAEFRDVDAEGAVATLDALGAELAAATAGRPEDPLAEARACTELLGGVHGFEGDQDEYDDPENSMLDAVLVSRRGLPILLSIVYAAVGRRAGLPLHGVGLPGHFVVGHFGTAPPLLLDPFTGGELIVPEGGEALVRPWSAQEIALRMLNNLVASFQRRGRLTEAIRAAEMRLELPVEAPMREGLRNELRGIRARLN